MAIKKHAEITGLIIAGLRLEGLPRRRATNIGLTEIGLKSGEKWRDLGALASNVFRLGQVNPDRVRGETHNCAASAFAL
ncbi:hypothetical protein [Bradyrhizobium monzae]|uniref:hypothetical protein n=1 Tax=Bradyrhizobium sp. Oc8 TaxID=2876780 RepID=UPI001F296392|nr:hypothetical protein [Bradyrhizobium sp. Oc8]